MGQQTADELMNEVDKKRQFRQLAVSISALFFAFAFLASLAVQLSNGYSVVESLWVATSKGVVVVGILWAVVALHYVLDAAKDKWGNGDGA